MGIPSLSHSVSEFPVDLMDSFPSRVLQFIRSLFCSTVIRHSDPFLTHMHIHTPHTNYLQAKKFVQRNWKARNGGRAYNSGGVTLKWNCRCCHSQVTHASLHLLWALLSFHSSLSLFLLPLIPGTRQKLLDTMDRSTICHSGNTNNEMSSQTDIWKGGNILCGV